MTESPFVKHAKSKGMLKSNEITSTISRTGHRGLTTGFANNPIEIVGFNDISINRTVDISSMISNQNKQTLKNICNKIGYYPSYNSPEGGIIFRDDSNNQYFDICGIAEKFLDYIDRK